MVEQVGGVFSCAVVEFSAYFPEKVGKNYFKRNRLKTPQQRTKKHPRPVQPPPAGIKNGANHPPLGITRFIFDLTVDVAKVAEYIVLSVKYTYVIATLVCPHTKIMAN